MTLALVRLVNAFIQVITLCFFTVFWIKDLGQGNLIVFNVLADILLVCCGTLKQKRSAHENICMFILFNCTFLGRAKF